MSGYLKRMAASITRPAVAVHPLVTNVFAKEARLGGGTETGEVETQTERHRPFGPRFGSQAQELQAADAERERWLFADSDADAADSRRMDSEADASMQVGATSPRERLVPGWKQATIEERSEVHRVEEDRGPFRGDVDGWADRGAEGTARKFVPIVKRTDEAAHEEDATSVANDHLQSGAMAGGLDFRREAVAGQQAKIDEARSGGEEIQIHIGRIEVIAVAQPAQRQAPARAQRGETLEAYLKRHDRRSR